MAAFARWLLAGVSLSRAPKGGARSSCLSCSLLASAHLPRCVVVCVLSPALLRLALPLVCLTGSPRPRLVQGGRNICTAPPSFDLPFCSLESVPWCCCWSTRCRRAAAAAAAAAAVAAAVAAARALH
ncbi:hypothetical protein IWX91DRAFT_184708 [Phyllosticta citricarpa]